MGARDGYIVWERGQQERLLDGDVVSSKAKVMQYVATARGRVLSSAYDLEVNLDRVIVWHLFRDRDDGMAAFFEDNILREHSFGLDRKCKLVGKLARDWLDERDDAKAFADLLDSARRYRNMCAHWPARLYPVTTADGLSFRGLEVKLEKGDERHGFEPDDVNSWLDVLVQAGNTAFALAERIQESTRQA